MSTITAPHLTQPSARGDILGRFLVVVFHLHCHFTPLNTLLSLRSIYPLLTWHYVHPYCVVADLLLLFLLFLPHRDFVQTQCNLVATCQCDLLYGTSRNQLFRRLYFHTPIHLFTAHKYNSPIVYIDALVAWWLLAWLPCRTLQSTQSTQPSSSSSTSSSSVVGLYFWNQTTTSA